MSSDEGVQVPSPEPTPPPFGRSTVLMLPSGVRVRARRPSIISLIASGGFPTELTGMVWKLANRDASVEDLVQNADDLIRMTQLINAYILNVLVSPKLSMSEETALVAPPEEQPQMPWAGVVNLADMEDVDKQFLFLYGQGLLSSEVLQGATGARSLETFRDGAVRVGSGSDGEAVRTETIEPDRVAPGGSGGAEL